MIARWVSRGAMTVLCAGVAVVVWAVLHTHRAFCMAHVRGATPAAAIDGYLSRCGSNYTRDGGPVYYRPHELEYGLNVADDDEGTVTWIVVARGRDGRGWRTVGEPGTGP